MRVARQAAVLALCAGAAVVVLLGGPAWLSLLVVGAFMLAAPGLVLVEMLRVRDGLLGLVLAMVAGPALWVVVSTVEVFVGVWVPQISVLVVSGSLALTATLLLLAVLRGESVLEVSRHRFRSHQHDRTVVDASGRHRGAFPSPGARIQSGTQRRQR